ncbi:MAG: thioredoxin family protein [Acidimicrobiia bacterium]|nr:thioredoxin family protein [Acidimicrobiia bacterium]
MVARIIIGLVVVGIAAVVAVGFERRRAATGAPVRDPFRVPRQLHRSDFDRPDAPWLVALFSSTVCEGCVAMHDKVLAVASPEVVAVDLSFQAEREIHERYEISGVPMVLIADADGVVQRAFIGAVSATDLWAALAAARDPSLDISHGLDALM